MERAPYVNVANRLVPLDPADNVPAFEPSVSQLAWEATGFYNNTATTNQPFTGTAISSGTSNAPAASTYDALHPGYTRTTSSTTANGGYRWQTARELRGGAGLFTRAVVNWEVTANVTVRGGFHDSVTSADAVDGVYWEAIGTTLSFKSANNSTRTTHGTTYTISAGVWYVIDVEYLTSSSAQLTIRTDDGTVVYQQTIATNVPNTAARSFFCGVVATESTTTANQMIWLDYMGVGPARPKGGGVKGDTGDDGPPGAAAAAHVTVETISGTSYTFATADLGKYKRTTNGSAVAITVDASATVPFAVGDILYARQGGAGAITFAGAGGVTINPPAGGTLVSAGQGGVFALVNVATDEWDLIGQTTAA